MRNKIIKEELVWLIQTSTGFPRSIVEDVLNETLDKITEALSEGKEVQFAGFGTFEPKQRAARTGRNPHTNEPVPIPARIVPVFNPGKSLKKAVCKEVEVV